MNGDGTLEKNKTPTHAVVEGASSVCGAIDGVVCACPSLTRNPVARCVWIRGFPTRSPSLILVKQLQGNPHPAKNSRTSGERRWDGAETKERGVAWESS